MESITLKSLLLEAKRQRLLVLGLVLAGVSVAAILAFTLKPKYEASSIFLVEQGSKKKLPAGLGLLSGLTPEETGVEQYLDIIEQIINSRDFLQSFATDSLTTETGRVALTDYLGAKAGRKLSLEEQVYKLLLKSMSFKPERINTYRLKVESSSPVGTVNLNELIFRHLRSYYHEIRTKKESDNVIYLEKIFNQAAEYYDSVSDVAAQFREENRSISSPRIIQKNLKFEIKLKLASERFITANAELQSARSDFQRNKPMFVVVESAYLPMNKSFPNRKLFLLCGIIVGTGLAAMAIIGTRLLKSA